ncbi:MAG: DUF4301 family protein [Candidatus Omnitrophota bacterium]|nr:DUF4301 family protein [Candidatus Omnitrophota bacterium]
MPKTSPFTAPDRKQIAERGSTLERVLEQIEALRKGFPFVKLVRPCTLGDGITLVPDAEVAELAALSDEAVAEGRFMKFVPASGAASRMFKSLLAVHGHGAERLKLLAGNGNAAADDDEKAFVEFAQNLRKFAFFEHLKEALKRKGQDIETLTTEREYLPVLEGVLFEAGLGYALLPKGLILFHDYPGRARTAFEEHLVESREHARDAQGKVLIHFTVAQEHREQVCEYLQSVLSDYETSGTHFEITYSVQKSSTDTIAVDLKNCPFRDKSGSLVFRPAGHGALLENLEELRADLVFIKNIDNIVPDHMKEETYKYKKILGGYLVRLQKQIFSWIKTLEDSDPDEKQIESIHRMAGPQIVRVDETAFSRLETGEQIAVLLRSLNRPIRVCAMVPNRGEPGGGPFWIQGTEGISLQIVEKAQIDRENPVQKGLLSQATHFNPVDMVCGLRDRNSIPYRFAEFTDPQMGFITRKSKDGKELKSLEVPGLWNGAMAEWITVFLEVPLHTFNPVKTVNDLLRPEHQPQKRFLDE